MIIFFILACIFCLHVSLKYYEYTIFKENQSLHVNATVLLKYQKISKNNKKYFVLKTLYNGFNVYIISWKSSLNIHVFDEISFNMNVKNVTFKDFFAKSFFVPSSNIKLKHSSNSIKQNLQNFIQNQHKNDEVAQVYQALFLATPINKQTRDKIQNLGISHLVAISGFHLGVAYFALFFVIKSMFIYFQNRHFPYININIYIGYFIFFVLILYTYLIDFAPSFVRSLMMSFLGFYMYKRGIKILSFTNLALSVMVLLCIFPHFLLSISFFFSVLGVFYIFLYFHHFKGVRIYDAIFLNTWVFFAMIVPTHFWFGYTSFTQLYSILLSIVFVVFYPFSFVLHVIGYGDLLDNLIQNLLDINSNGKEIFTSFWQLSLYLIFSFFSIFSKKLAILVVFVGVIYLFLI